MILMISFLLLLFPTTGYATSDRMPTIDIETFPADVLFSVDHLKPGDWIPRELIIVNQGDDRTYVLSASFVSGSKALYNIMDVTIKDEWQTLHSGKLKDFRKLDSRALSSGEDDVLFITVTFPEEAGNEYQGLQTDIVFQIRSEGRLSTLQPPIDFPADGSMSGPGGILPQTGEAVQTWMYLIGILLLSIGIVFLIRKNRKESLEGGS
ncbi:LPXTG cell wall anchor domain-containing protein [Halalkalibacterium halodurans]|uniref:LPXTG cell wall anchor domain-containing protein n=1 Tax=Halalkalibacterium halodurans TaxID=86665 RepID=UPI001FBA8B94|nr:LPXTG cell wall anchor domain-containing protein [Halalkalibacterium halodurans]MED3647609.1 LPXTG cell wall anchor domain-containing protein [Halalkalibacterium halodurans]